MLQNLGPIHPRLRPAPPSSAGKGSSKAAPLKASHHIARSVCSPDSSCTTPDSMISSADGDSWPTGQHPDTETTARYYDFFADIYGEGVSEVTPRERPGSRESDCSSGSEKDVDIRRYQGIGLPRRMLSPARVKVVPVGSILDPRDGSVSNQTFMPTPPPAGKKPHLHRPSTAERFRKMVMNYREAT